MTRIRKVKWPGQRARRTFDAVVQAFVIGLAIAGLAAILCSTLGCGAPMPGFRFAPVESQKQAAQTADDMAKAAPYVGLQPGSEAAKLLAKSTGPTRAYLGSPSNPVDIWPIMESQRGAWETKAQQIKALKLKERLMSRANALIGAGLAEFTELAAEESQVKSNLIIPRAIALVSFYDMAMQLSAEIEVPKDSEVASDLAARIQQLDSRIAKMVADADTQAARRPTGKEVAEATVQAIREGSETAKGVAATIGQIAAYWGLPAIGGTGILGAILYGKKKKQQVVVETARAETAERERAMAEKSIEAIDKAFVGTAASADATKSMAADLVKMVTDTLAKAEPPKPSESSG